jgi:hypothetical protein
MYLAGFQAAVLLLTFGLCSTAGHIFASTFKNGPDSVPFDERDQLIELKANRICFNFAFSAFVVVCVSFWGYYHFRGIDTISIDVLTALIWPPFIIQFLSHDIILLVLYHKDNTFLQGEAS